MAWFTAKGKISYGAAPNMRKRAEGAWVHVDVPNGIAMYYRHMLIRNVINPFGQEDETAVSSNPPLREAMTKVHPPMRGAHITVLDGRIDVGCPEKWGIHANKIVEFEYSNEIEQIWKFFVLPVRSPVLTDIRHELGITQNHPFHITIGRMES